MARKLSKAKLKKFHKNFNDRKAELIKVLSNKTDHELDTDGDDVDIVQGNVISSVASKLSRRELDTLEKLNDSLQKISDGTFGICEECDELIGEKRLEAYPGCTLCINCKEEEEKAARQFA